MFRRFRSRRTRQIEASVNEVAQEFSGGPAWLTIYQPALRLQCRLREQNILISLDEAIRRVASWQRRQERKRGIVWRNR